MGVTPWLTFYVPEPELWKTAWLMNYTVQTSWMEWHFKCADDMWFSFTCWVELSVMRSTFHKQGYCATASVLLTMVQQSFCSKEQFAVLKNLFTLSNVEQKVCMCAKVVKVRIFLKVICDHLWENPAKVIFFRCQHLCVLLRHLY
jgi:hypothetical protein